MFLLFMLTMFSCTNADNTKDRAVTQPEDMDRLFSIVKNGDYEALSKIDLSKMDLNKLDKDGFGLIHYAAQNVMNMQIKRDGSNIDITKGMPGILSKLVSNGASLGLVSTLGKSVVDYASGNAPLLETLCNIAVSVGKVAVTTVISRTGEQQKEKQELIDIPFKLFSGETKSLRELQKKHK